MEIVPYCKDYLVRYGELKDELERIIRVYPDGFADKVSLFFFLFYRVSIVILYLAERAAKNFLRD